MKPHPDCPVDHEGDTALIACLKAEVAELRACLAVPVRFTSAAGTWDDFLALDTEGRLWHASRVHSGYHWTPIPGPTLEPP